MTTFSFATEVTAGRFTTWCHIISDIMEGIRHISRRQIALILWNLCSCTMQKWCQKSSSTLVESLFIVPVQRKKRRFLLTEADIIPEHEYEKCAAYLHRLNKFGQVEQVGLGQGFMHYHSPAYCWSLSHAGNVIFSKGPGRAIRSHWRSQQMQHKFSWN